jgi:N-acetylglucosamine-6-sulfatase
VACQPPLDRTDERFIDQLATRRCKALMGVDDSVSMMVEKLGALGELEHTYVIFTSDHGYNLGHHRLAFGKFVSFEHALRIPLVIMGPGITPGSSFDFLGTNVDIAPTVLGMAGLGCDGCDGRSVLPLLIRRGGGGGGAAKLSHPGQQQLPDSVRRHLASGSPTTPAPRTATLHEYYISTEVARQPGSHRRVDDWSNTWIGVHVKGDAALGGLRGDLKYAVYDPYGRQSNFSQPYMRELFNLTADPFELVNLYNATRRSDPVLVEGLEARLRQLFACAGAATCG